MATDTQKKRAIKYLNKDFSALKRDLIEHLRVYFPDTIQDFNESSVGMMLLELGAYIGDNLSFYSDRQFAESFTELARERKNVFKNGKQLGFKAYGKASAIGVVDAFLKVPAIRQNEEIIPDMRYAGVVQKGAKLKSDSGETYETLLDIDFSEVDISDSDFVTVVDRDATTQEPTSFMLKKINVDVKAGETKESTFSIGAYEAFKRLTISDTDVLEVLSVTDAEGNEWFEVDFLAQDTIFTGVSNTGDDATEVPYVLKLKPTPFRFITEFDVETTRMDLVFGTGDAESFDGELIPDLGDLALPLFGKDSFTDFFLDPQNFLKTRTLGLAPVNTTLTVKYRTGGGVSTNAGVGEISTVAESIFAVGDSSLDATTIKDVGNSFGVFNSQAIQGGKDEPSLDEVRQLIAAHFATQSRAVTTQDFVVRSLSMPTRFGSVFRANSRPSPINKNAVELIILSKNSNNQVTTAPAQLKNNLKTYLSRFRMLTDAIEILDGEILNIAVNFEILTDPDFNKAEVLTNCIEALKEFFDIDVWQINQPLNITSIYKLLAGVPGVLSLINLDVVNRVGTFDGRSYSTSVHNISENTQNGIIYAKENAIFEIKFPNKDITGTAK